MKSEAQEVAEIINREFGNNVSNLKKAKAYYESLTSQKQELEKRLYCRSEVASEGVGQVLEDCQDAKNNLEKLSSKYLQLKSQLSDLLNQVERVRSQFQGHVDQILELEKLSQYLIRLKDIEDISNQLAEDLQQGKRQSAIHHYQELLEIWKNLKNTKCCHFARYLSKTIVYWYEILKERFGIELDKLFGPLHWPSSCSVTVSRPTPDTLTKFEMLFCLLMQLEIPNELLSLTNKTFEEELPNQVLPLQLMLNPLQKRFIYHFAKSKKTSRLDKPEWYLTQILTWIRDNSEFMEKHVQVILDKANLKVNAELELIRGLVSVACWKLSGDLPQLVLEDHLLSHTLDEVLLFQRELLVLGYSPQQAPNLLSLVTSEACFTKWLSLELKSAEERMDQIFSGEGAWKYRYPISDDLDELKVPQFAEAFMTMLMLMTERYKALPDSHAQLEFLSLQLKLVDDFRLRLQQLRHAEAHDPLKSRFAAIFNSVHYVIAVLKEWSNLPFFLQLYYTKQCFSANRSDNSNEDPDGILSECQDIDEEDLSGSVFQSVLSLYSHMEKDLLRSLQLWILSDVKAKSRPYRKEKWFSIVASEISELSYSAYPMLKVLKENLHQAQLVLSLPLCTKLLHAIASNLSQYLYEEVILQNLFSEGGANQLLQDLTRNLIPIFGSCMVRPESYFKELKESCLLLALPKGPALLLREVLQNSEKRSYGIEALEEQGIFRLSVTKALKVLRQRNDSCM